MIVVGVATISMIGLFTIQVRLMERDIDLYEQTFNAQVPDLFRDYSDRINKNESIQNLIHSMNDRYEFQFISTDDQLLPELETIMKSELRQLMAENNLNIDFEMKGIVDQKAGCLYYSKENQRMEPKSLSGDILNAENFMCVCGAGHPDTAAFDISLGYPNQLGSMLSITNPTFIVSSVFLLLIICSFGYTVLTIQRQRKLSELKNDFINNLTHEFKTPIFSISLASGLLRKSKAIRESAQLMKYTDLIDNEGKRLKSQVDKVLQMALVDSGNFKLEKKEIDIHSIIKKVAKNFDLILEGRNGALSMKLDAKKHVIFADETHLNNIVYNLLDNALKYSPDQPEIEVCTQDEKEGLCLVIRDNGIGMNKEVQKFIFDKFYRAGSGNIHNVKGFGLGLSYVKKVVEAHKGTISLESTKNSGSEFMIHLPC